MPTLPDFDLDEVGVDLSDVKDIPDGEYNVTITEMKPHVTKKGAGEKAALITFTVNSPVEFAGRKVFQVANLSGKGAYLIKGLLVHFALAQPDEDRPTARVTQLLDRTLNVYVKTNEPTDEFPTPRAGVNRVLPD